MDLTLGQRLRCWPNVNSTFVERLVFAGKAWAVQWACCSCWLVFCMRRGMLPLSYCCSWSALDLHLPVSLFSFSVLYYPRRWDYTDLPWLWTCSITPQWWIKTSYWWASRLLKVKGVWLIYPTLEHYAVLDGMCSLSNITYIVFRTHNLRRGNLPRQCSISHHHFLFIWSWHWQLPALIERICHVWELDLLRFTSYWCSISHLYLSICKF